MKEKLKSKKFWISLLADIVSITMIFSNIGGTVGTIIGVIGIVASTIFHLLIDKKLDIENIKSIIEKFNIKSDESSDKGGE